MLVESRLGPKTVVYVDCEAVGGVNKEDMTTDFHPDDILDHVVRLGAGVASRLATAAEDSASAMPPPRQVEIAFGVRVDSNATVAIARTPDEGQFRVKVSWQP
jgi:hypothetical protein